jgi:hypothetical protein
MGILSARTVVGPFQGDQKRPAGNRFRKAPTASSLARAFGSHTPKPTAKAARRTGVGGFSRQNSCRAKIREKVSSASSASFQASPDSWQ